MAVPNGGREPTLFGEMVLEFLGSAVVALFGFGVVAQVVVSKNGLGAHDSISWAWGFGVTFGIFVAGKVTGAHLNPAVTVAVLAFRRFPASKVAPYIVAQVAGWFAGAAVIRFDYSAPIRALDPHHTYTTQGIFSTLPGNGDNALGVTIGDAFWDQVIGTAALLFLIFAVTDPLGAAPTPAVSALAVGFIVVAIGMAIGTDSGYAINPARDFGPRLLEFLTGYDDAWTDQHGQIYFWVPILGPVLGGLIGGGCTRRPPGEYSRGPWTEFRPCARAHRGARWWWISGSEPPPGPAGATAQRAAW
ncbi:aquaporin [Curtobacterium flaccumfaciens]|nr:aquaporin [Curtobacterium flaccumfaciens]